MVFFIMKKIRIKNRYGTVPNALLNSDQISFKAKGIYAYIQSKPDDWDFSVERISSQVKEGKPSIAAALKELENAGYLSRIRYQAEFGYWVSEYVLHEFPIKESLHTGIPMKENPIAGKPSNISNKDLSNKEYIYNNISKKDKDIDQILSNRDLIFEKWFDYKREKKQSYKPIGKQALIKTWESATDDQLEKAIDHSISNNWNGIFAKKEEINNITKGKHQTNLENIELARQQIQKLHENGTYKNPFAIGD
jgi:Mn-dependent DtxR family transcriptional regulator